MSVDCDYCDRKADVVVQGIEYTVDTGDNIDTCHGKVKDTDTVGYRTFVHLGE